MAKVAVRIGLAGCLAATLWAGHAWAVDILPKFGKKDPKVQQASTAPKPGWSASAAEVNGEKITREQLAEELLDTYGKKHIDLMINRKIVEQACRERKIEITQRMMEDDLQATLTKLNLKRSEFVERVLGQRELTLSQYMRDTVWPALALKALVEKTVTITNEDLDRAFVANFGDRVDCRMLVVLELRKAQELWEKANKETDLKKRLLLFEELCKTFSVDQATRSFGGRCQPISRHSGYPQIEKLAFDLKPGELSRIEQLPDQSYVMLLCVEKIPARKDITLDSVAMTDEKTKKQTTWRQYLSKEMLEKKTRYEISNYFVELQKKAEINDYLNHKLSADKLKTADYKEPAKSKSSEVKRAANVVPEESGEK